MDNVNVQANAGKKKILLAVFIPLLIVGIILYIFLMYIGILQYPNWYLKANFRANKQYFETIINTGECDGFSGGQEYYIDEITDPEVKTAIQELCVDGIWGSFYKEYRQDEEDEYIYLYGDDYSIGTDEKQREAVLCIFRPNNFSDYNVRGIIYAKDEDLLNSKFSNANNLYHIEGNWYYFQHCDNDPWDKGG